MSVRTEADGRDRRSPGPIFLSVRQAARLLGTSPITLYRAIDAGQFPAIRVRGRLIIPVRALDAMAAAAVRRGIEVDAADFVERSDGAS